MADAQVPSHPETTDPMVVACGGLQFAATFRAPAGATLRVTGDVDGQATELLRFDDFVDGPHYHVPASAAPTPFDPTVDGEPLTWFVAQLRDHLADLLTDAGFARLLPAVDVGAVSDHAEEIRRAMEASVPAGYVRVPGVGLRRSPA